MGVHKDRGWAWMVSLGAFLAMLLETGVVKALGVLLPVLRQEFTTHTWVIGLSIALVPGFGAVTCPFAGALSKRFSPRSTAIIFSLISAMGLITASLATSEFVLLISLLLTGLSVGVEAVLVGELARYFDKHYDVANVMAQVGLSMGIIVMPPLTQFLLNIYGWRGTVLILGGIYHHLVVCGTLLRPVTVHKPGQNCIDDSGKEKQWSDPNDKLIKNIAKYLDLDLFRELYFISMLCCWFGTGYCLTGWVIYLVPHAIDIGFLPYQASLLATVGGLGTLAGNIVYPFGKRTFSNEQILYFAALISFFALATDPLFSAIYSYIGLMFSSAAYGFGRGLIVLSMFRILKDSVEGDRMTNAVAWQWVAYSVGALLSGFLLGWIYDQRGNYTVSFLILSAGCLLAVCPHYIVDTKIKRRNLQYSPVP